MLIFRGCNKTLFSMNWEEKTHLFPDNQEEDGSGPSFAGKPTPVLDVSAKESLGWNKETQEADDLYHGIRMDKDGCKVSTKVQQKIIVGSWSFLNWKRVFYEILGVISLGSKLLETRGGCSWKPAWCGCSHTPSIQKASAWCYMASRYL